jgi:hypothetical protein
MYTVKRRVVITRYRRKKPFETKKSEERSNEVVEQVIEDRVMMYNDVKRD